MSEHIPLYPFLLNPTLHVKVWGGRKLADVLQKPLATDEPYGESWELHDSSVIANGALNGRTLGDVLAEYGTALVGEGNDPAEGFPLLAKLLDASDWLSIQVHPNDVQANALEGQPRGKTEAWIILDSEPDAKLVIGMEAGTTSKAMATAIRDNTLEEMIVYADVVPGDVLYIPAGTVHAIGPGILLYEIQQSSNTTYRLYDWGRMGLDGEPRKLHIDKGVQVSNLATLPEIKHTGADTSPVVTLVDGEFFTTTLHHLVQSMPTTIQTNGRFHAITCIEASAQIEWDDSAVLFRKGQTILVPASLPEYTLRGEARVLRSWQDKLGG
ncbi:MAG: class I mannose-6-phosphate isomerase [Aggregatilineales bacterium]